MNNSLKKRHLAILFIFTLVSVFLVVKLFTLQILDYRYYNDLQQKQVFTEQAIQPTRGKILGASGSVFALNIPTNLVYANCINVKKNKLPLDLISRNIATIIDCDETEILNKFHKENTYTIIKRQVDPEKITELSNWISSNKIMGIYFEDDQRRVYPNKNLAAQVIGFTGTDNQGLLGIEYCMENYLRGTAGKQILNPDTLETNNTSSHIVPKQDGNNIKLTIEEYMQNIVEKALEQGMEDNKVLNNSCAIAIDPRNGNILALSSKPDFDLNAPFEYTNKIPEVSNTKWESMDEDERIAVLQSSLWKNNAISMTYEPGSTFKVVAAAAGLEEGLISLGSLVDDSPERVMGWTIKCDHSPDHGKERFDNAIYNSCNPVFVRLGKILGMETFYKYVKAFGINDLTNVDLPGESKSIIHAKPTLIDMSVSTFGQGIQITPVQLAMIYCSIANGGQLLKPQIISEITDSDGNTIKKYDKEVIRNVLSKQTCDLLTQALEGVITKGTGKKCYIPGYKIAGKTGTSETFVNGSRSKERYISSFAAFAPSDNPSVCVLVMCDYPSGKRFSGGEVAAPIVKNILKDYFYYAGIEANYSESDRQELLSGTP